MSSASPPVCWVVTAGVAGMENQCLGLAEALGFSPIVKRIALRTPFKQLVPFLRHGLSYAFCEKGDPIAPPWPDVMIASGRAGAAACLLARKASRRAQKQGPFTIYIQNPVIDPSRFDLVAVPRHDNLWGDTVITTRGALHRATPERLRQEAASLAPSLAHLPSPRIAVLLGGRNAVYAFGQKEMTDIATRLAQLAKETHGSLLITTSRRTGAANVALLRAALENVPHVLWSGEGPNPYYAFLGLAEAILVTADSVNMTSEACSTGKPVHVIALPGGSAKFRVFHQTLYDDGLTRPFENHLEKWTYTPLDDVALVAARARRMLREKDLRA